MEYSTCHRCKKNKPNTDFYRYTVLKQPVCKECYADQMFCRKINSTTLESKYRYIRSLMTGNIDKAEILLDNAQTNLANLKRQLSLIDKYYEHDKLRVADSSVCDVFIGGLKVVLNNIEKMESAIQPPRSDE